MSAYIARVRPHYHTHPVIPADDRATDKQQAFLTTLLAERQHTYTADLDTITRKQASEMITVLLGSPRQTATPTAAPKVTETGVYGHGEDLYYVTTSRSTGNLYAMRLNFITRSRDYAPGIVRQLTAEGRLTVEQVAALNLPFGWCCLCGRDLTDPASVKAGIGPVCASKYE